MAAIILKIELNGKIVDYTLVTTDRPNIAGDFGARLFDSEMKPVGRFLSPARSECLKQFKKQMESKHLNHVTNLYGYNIPNDVRELLMGKC